MSKTFELLKKRAVELRITQGLSTHMIAYDLNVNYDTVKHWVKPYSDKEDPQYRQASRLKRSLVGERYSRLLVVERLNTKSVQGGRFQVSYRCICDCGNEIIRPYGNLQGGRTGSCGCLARERSAARCKSRALPNGEVRLNIMENYYRGNAKKAGHIWGLSRIEFRELVTNQSCTYCGTDCHIGIDRIDSAQGYSKGNVAPCCKFCNWAKSVYTIEEFKEWIVRVYNHFGKIEVNDGCP